MQKTLMNAGMAFGGGLAAEMISDMIAKNAGDWVAENPKVTELAPAGVGAALLFFMPGKLDPVAYGMIGASGAGMADDLLGEMQGFNRLTLQGAEEYSRGREFVESLIKEGFDNSSESFPMGNFTEVEEAYGDGMS